MKEGMTELTSTVPWEYRVEAQYSLDNWNMNLLGMEGWELVSVVSIPGASQPFILVYKRINQTAVKMQEVEDVTVTADRGV